MDKKPEIEYPFSRESYKRLRGYWRPETVDTLFVGESPPKNRRSYFFNHNTGIGRGLFSYITCALNIRETTKEERLWEFKRRNFWLIDVFQEPIKDIKEKDIESHLAEFKGELEKAKPERIVVAIPKRRLGSAWRHLVLMYLLQVPNYKPSQLIVISKWTRGEFNEKLKEFRAE